MGLLIGPLHVRRSIYVRATVRRVWNEFSSFDRIKRWFGTGHELHAMELNVGGAVDLSIENEYGMKTGDDGRIHMLGTVLVHEEEREISFETRWQFYEDSAPALWTIRLTALYEGTLVEIFQHGMELAGDEAADRLQGNEEGWDIRHLKILRDLVEN